MDETTAVVPPEGGSATKPSPQGALTLQQAVAKLLAEKRSAAQAPAAPQVSQGEEAADAEATNQQTTLESAPAEGVAGDQSQEPEEQAETGDEEGGEGQAFELSVDSRITLPDGTTWTGQELQDGILKKKDYTQKTQVLQQERQAVVDYVQQVQSKVSEFEQGLQQQRQQAQAELAAAAAERDRWSKETRRLADAQKARLAQWDKVDWVRLGEEQPGRVVALWQQREQERQQLEAAEASLTEQEAQARAEQEQQQLQAREAYARNWLSSRQALLDYVKSEHPIFTDPEKSNAEWGKISTTLRGVGMPEEVIQSAFGVKHSFDVPLVSVPIFKLIHKAALYDAAVAQHTKATAPGKPAGNGVDPPRIRVVKADSTRTFRPPTPDKAAVGRAHAKFNKSGSLRDGVAYELAKMQAALKVRS